MTHKNKLYATGTAICVVAIGAVVFYLIKNNSGSKTASADQANLAQNDTSQNLQNQPSENPVNDSATPIAPASDNSTADSNSPSDATNSTSSPATSGVTGRHGPMVNIPAGSKPIFGQVASVSGSQIVVTTMGRRGNPATSGGTAADSTTTPTTTPTKTTINVTITSSTTFSGGTKDAIVVGTRIFSYGVANADGSIDATNIQINPTMPSGGGFNRGGQNQNQ